MSDKFNIDDSILLDPDTARSNNIKKILTGIAILVVLFLIILLTMKFINSGDTATNEPLVMPSEDVIFTPKNSTTEKKPAEQKTVVEIKTVEKVEPKVIEIKVAQESKKEDIKPVVVETKQKEPKNVETKQQTTQPIEPKVVETKQPEPKKEVVVVTANKTEVKKTQAPRKKEPAKVETPKQEVTKKEDVKKTNPTKEEITKPTKTQSLDKEASKQSPKPTKKGTQISGTTPSGRYIQILATTDFKADDPALLKLVNAGYSYRLHKEIVNGKEFTKILVGPYSGDKLQNEISSIRATVNKDAFVYRVK